MIISVLLPKIGICVGILSALFLSSLTGASSAQVPTGSKPPAQLAPNKDILKVVIALFGVNADTGNVLSFVKLNDVTVARFFNASKENTVDKDGIVTSTLSFPNETVSAGANFTACAVILKGLTMSCKSQLNIPAITEVVQIVIPTEE